jgi:hypothetical protein
MKKKTNLFLIGAPKCGTTSLAESLSSFQEISLGKKKEPNFFNSDFKNLIDCNDINEYLNLYNFNNDSIYFLDSSTVYLRSQDAVSNIIDFNSQSKFILCYRKNLTKMFVSVYNQLYKSQKIKVPLSKVKDINDISMLDEIISICNLGEQIQKLLDRIDDINSILFIPMNELDNMEKIDRRLSRFLNVKMNQYYKRKSNVGVKRIRSKSLPILVAKLNKLKLFFGLKHISFGFNKQITKMNHERGNSYIHPYLISQIVSVLESYQINFDECINKLNNISKC